MSTPEHSDAYLFALNYCIGMNEALGDDFVEPHAFARDFGRDCFFNHYEDFDVRIYPYYRQYCSMYMRFTAVVSPESATG